MLYKIVKRQLLGVCFVCVFLHFFSATTNASECVLAIAPFNEKAPWELAEKEFPQTTFNSEVLSEIELIEKLGNLTFKAIYVSTGADQGKIELLADEEVLLSESVKINPGFDASYKFGFEDYHAIVVCKEFVPGKPVFR